MVAVGRASEVRGFALAGVETARCETTQEAELVLEAIASDASVGLLMVPAWLERVARFRGRGPAGRRGPIVLVLPQEDGG
jgi:vacuolar-type H+-ATPase subunit F/Vma7